jgi:hypothetical protein
VIVGANRAFTHEGREYHIQAEDLGEEAGCFEVRVYEHGAVLWNKRVPYADVLDRGLPRPAQEDTLREMMQKTLHTVQAAIVKGKLARE